MIQQVGLICAAVSSTTLTSATAGRENNRSEATVAAAVAATLGLTAAFSHSLSEATHEVRRHSFGF